MWICSICEYKFKKLQDEIYDYVRKSNYCSVENFLSYILNKYYSDDSEKWDIFNYRKSIKEVNIISGPTNCIINNRLYDINPYFTIIKKSGVPYVIIGDGISTSSVIKISNFIYSKLVEIKQMIPVDMPNELINLFRINNIIQSEEYQNVSEYFQKKMINTGQEAKQTKGLRCMVFETDCGYLEK